MNIFKHISAKISMRWRLGIVLITSMLALVAIGLVGVVAVRSVNRMVVTLSNDTIPSLEALTNLQKSLMDCQISLLELTLPGIADAEIEATYNRTKAELKHFQERLDYLQQGQLSSIEAEQLAIARSAWVVVQEEIHSSLELVISGSAADREKFAVRYRDHIEHSRSIIQKSVKSIVDFQRERALSTRAAAEAMTQRMHLTLSVMMGLLLLFIVLAGTFLIQNIDRALHQIMASVLTHSHEVFGSAKKVDSISQAIDDGAQSTSGSLQICVSNLAEIAQMVDQSHENANRSTQLATLAREATLAGDQAVTEIAEAMQGIEDTTERFVLNMEDRAKDVATIAVIFHEITEKARLINDIVFQTKLLSFNASVEAARAGEYGKGFSVVAEEVAKLSKMTGEVASQISKLLVESSKQVDSVVERIQQTSTEVRTQATSAVKVANSRVDKGRKHLKSIVQHSTDMKFNTDQISEATREQSLAIQQISNSLHQLQQMANTNATKAHDSNDVVHKLVGAAGKMEQTVTGLQMFLDGVKDKLASAKATAAADDAELQEWVDEETEETLPKAV